MTTWVICGAGRGVGKTHLARRLCDVLPGSVYAKCGHGIKKEDGAANFFRSTEALRDFMDPLRDRTGNFVVESNDLARQREGDVIVFVGPIPGVTDVRDDADLLRESADVQIASGFSMRDCKRVLRAKVPDSARLETVCDIFADQNLYLAGPAPAVRSKIWFTVGGMHAFGSGLARLLEAINRTQTLTDAAMEMQMSYRHAWKMLRTAEKHLGKKLILPRTGGSGGGGTDLSGDGLMFLDVFQRLNRDVATFTDKRFAELYAAQRRT